MSIHADHDGLQHEPDSNFVDFLEVVPQTLTEQTRKIINEIKKLNFNTFNPLEYHSNLFYNTDFNDIYKIKQNHEVYKGLWKFGKRNGYG